MTVSWAVAPRLEHHPARLPAASGTAGDVALLDADVGALERPRAAGVEPHLDRVGPEHARHLAEVLVRGREPAVEQIREPGRLERQCVDAGNQLERDAQGPVRPLVL